MSKLTKTLKAIKTEWMIPVRESQLMMNEHAPLEINATPTVVHRDCGMRYFNMSNEELNEFREAVQMDINEFSDEERLVEIADALGDEMFLLWQRIISYGLDDVFGDILEEILESNKTKLIGDRLKFNSEGKVLKPETYRKPNLRKVIFDK